MLLGSALFADFRGEGCRERTLRYRRGPGAPCGKLHWISSPSVASCGQTAVTIPVGSSHVSGGANERV
ncbi:unnamed protein product [Taenia asiatica]|uniref:Uncharacterized protein n=1 Tax=Taenia asiatica TaxID=60517 RepID=A0A0R3W515_TAEAS|nr:unnamed protein product [Taenia asiatica]